VQRVPPVVPNANAGGPRSLPSKPSSATGTALLIAGILAGLCLQLGPKQFAAPLWPEPSWRRPAFSLLHHLGSMLAPRPYTHAFSAAQTPPVGLALAATGFLFPFFPLARSSAGWAWPSPAADNPPSNVLFGNLQQVTAQTAPPFAHPHRLGQQLRRRKWAK